MPETTHAPDTSDSPRSFGFCSWHDGHAEGVRLIHIHEQGSGPGGRAFACPPCMEKHGLVPFADQPR